MIRPDAPVVWFASEKTEKIARLLPEIEVVPSRYWEFVKMKAGYPPRFVVLYVTPPALAVALFALLDLSFHVVRVPFPGCAPVP